MSARRRKESTEPPTLVVRAPEFDTCNFYVEALNPALNPKRILLQHVFFIDEDRTKYVSVSFYPARDYQNFVELGALLILTDQHVKTMAENLPKL